MKRLFSDRHRGLVLALATVALAGFAWLAWRDFYAAPEHRLARDLPRDPAALASRTIRGAGGLPIRWEGPELLLLDTRWGEVRYRFDHGPYHVNDPRAEVDMSEILTAVVAPDAAGEVHVLAFHSHHGRSAKVLVSIAGLAAVIAWLLLRYSLSFPHGWPTLTPR
ncbi:MAG: hypothetical protein HY719_15145 [Planctomycetes bacterium]|nr:hypothetical protein [Planctomycetota bacterium]